MSAAMRAEAPPRRRVRWIPRKGGGALALVVIATMCLIALLAPVIAPYAPSEQSILNRLEGPSAEHWLGTDQFGRDILSRLIWGARVSLSVGLVSVLSAMVLGTIVGIVSGYKGGKIDNAVMVLVNLLMSFPALLTGIIVVGLLGSGMSNVIWAIGIVLLPRFVRVARGASMGLRQRGYIEAARAAGAGELRVMFVHILPQLRDSTLVMATLWLSTAIRLEASLSFLGLGISPPTASWGNMIRDAIGYLSTHPLFVVFSSLALAGTVLAFNILGDALRDSLDPHSVN